MKERSLKSRGEKGLFKVWILITLQISQNSVYSQKTSHFEIWRTCTRKSYDSLAENKFVIHVFGFLISVQRRTIPIWHM